MNLTISTPAPSSASTEEERRLWEHIHELENQLRNVLDHLEAKNFDKTKLKELKKALDEL